MKSLVPTQDFERIQVLDLLRGFAIIGMFYVHMGMLPWIDSSILNDPPNINNFFYGIGRIFFNTKAVGLFSFLFGFGFALQIAKNKNKMQSFYFVYLRRMLGLLIIGCLIMLLGIRNDVLMLYAIAGIILLLLRNFKNGILIAFAIATTLVYLMVDAINMAPEFFGTVAEPVLTESLDEPVVKVVDRMEVFSSYSFIEQVKFNWSDLVKWYIKPYHFLYEIELLGLMIFGMIVMRMGWLHEIVRFKKLHKKLVVWGFIIGFSLTIIGIIAYNLRLQGGIKGVKWLFLNAAYYPIGSWPMQIGYIGAIALLSLHGSRSYILKSISAIGRMALSSFIISYIPYMFICYGWGMGQYGKVSTSVMVFVFFLHSLFLALFSVFWLKRFKYGPVEWAWRSFTYRKWLKLRK